MKALENAKTMGEKEVIAKIASAGLQEYGVFPEALTGKWAAKQEETDGKVAGVAAGINNSDTKRVLLNLLRTDADKIFEGMAVIAYALGTEELVLLLPESETTLAEELSQKAAEYGVRIENAFINVRKYGKYALHHIETMLAVAEVMEDNYTPGAYVSVAAEGGYGDLQKVSYGTRLSDVVSLEGAKAVEIGSHLYTPTAAAELVIDENLKLGDGVITVLDEKKCLMQECEARLLESRKTGCGKCTFCREGLNQLYGHITDITSGKGKKEALDMVKEIGEAMTFSCGCSVGTIGADFVLDAMDGFMGEFDAHIKKRNCPAGVCTCFMTIYIDPQLCEGCEECADVCPADCIEGKSGYIHMIDEFECTKCGKCIEACENEAVIQTTGRVPKLPNRLTKCGKFKKRR